MYFIVLLPTLISSQAVSFLQQDISCSQCMDSARLIAQAFFSQDIQDKEVSTFEGLCTLAVDPYVCSRLGESNGKIGFHSLYERFWNPSRLCYEAGFCTSDFVESPSQPVSIPSFGPTAHSTSLTRILIISDIHIDLAYTPGSEAVCNQPQCCRPIYTDPGNVTLPAGYWGTDTNCDVPKWTIEAVLESASKLQPDLVLWLGDTSPHDIWNYQPDRQSHNVQEVTDIIREKLGGIPVYPAIGNHECYPLDQYMPGGEQGLLESLASSWSPFLPPDVLSQFLINGFYHMQDSASGLHIISLNTQLSDILNFYISEMGPDPGNMLQWLEELLGDIEAVGEYAILMGHIPPGDHGADSTWAREYQRLSTRYKATIKGHFYAHTHNPQFYVIQDYDSPGLPVGVIFACPSITTYTGHEPAVRIVEIDQMGEIITLQDYAFPLAEANFRGKDARVSKLRLIFDANSYYEMKDLTPQSWFDLTHSFSVSRQFFALYWLSFNYGRYPPCDSNLHPAQCRLRTICETQHSVYDDLLACADVSGWDFLYLATERLVGK